MSLYINRDKQVTLRRHLLSLLGRVDRLKSVGVTVPMPERDSLASVYRALDDSIRNLREVEPTWDPKL